MKQKDKSQTSQKTFFHKEGNRRTISKKALARSQELGQNAADTDSLPKAASEIEEKLPLMKRGVIKKAWDKVQFLWEKFKSPEVPLRLKITIIGALLYMVLPADVIPDSIPGIGLIDDLSVILIVFREVSKYVLPKIEKKIEEKMYESCYQKIDEKLNLILFSMILNAIWTFLANALGCAVLVIKPFGNTESKYTAITIFSLVFVYTIIRTVIYLKKYGRTTRKITAAILKKRNISKGIADFVTDEYKYINYIYASIELAQTFIPEIPRIPDLSEIITTFEKHYKKRIILFLVIFALYTALIWVTKFLIIRGA